MKKIVDVFDKQARRMRSKILGFIHITPINAKIIIKYVKYFFWVEYHKNINSPITSAINAALEIVAKIAYVINRADP